MLETVNKRIVNDRPLFFAALLFGAGMLFANSFRLPAIALSAALAFLILASISLFFFADRRKRNAKRTHYFSWPLYMAVFFLGALLLNNTLGTKILDVSLQKEFAFRGSSPSPPPGSKARVPVPAFPA